MIGSDQEAIRLLEFALYILTITRGEDSNLKLLRHVILSLKSESIGDNDQFREDIYRCPSCNNEYNTPNLSSDGETVCPSCGSNLLEFVTYLERNRENYAELREYRDKIRNETRRLFRAIRKGISSD